MQVSDLSFLVVEDDAFQRHWLQAMLGNIGATNIFQAEDGHEALRILKEPHISIDISFIDLNLPGMDGMELIRHMSKREHTPSIVLASALAPSLMFSVETMSKAYGINLLGSIEKPATPELLLTIIQRHSLLPKTASELATTAIAPADILRGLTAHEFEPLFQPKVDLATGKVKGLEAFARWRHPQHGLLAPASFLGPLEAAAEVGRFDVYMFEKTISACRRLRERAPDLAVSMNISTRSCADPDFAENIIAYTDDEGFAPEGMTFEIPESSARDDAPDFLENVARLRMKGFGIAIDQYGTAHSSIQHLMRLPFSELKIDRSMIRAPENSPTLEIALELSIELCRRLERHSVAVGVETKSDWDLLQRLGCNTAQGFYIAHPMQEDAVALWMKEWAQFF